MKVIMFCAGGLSSSLLVNKVNEAARKRNINLVFEAYGSRSFTKLEGADALLVAPQVRHLKKHMMRKLRCLQHILTSNPMVLWMEMQYLT